MIGFKVITKNDKEYDAEFEDNEYSGYDSDEEESLGIYKIEYKFLNK